MTESAESIKGKGQEFDYSVVIPCYNSALWLEELTGQISGAMNTIGGSYEIILVCDASPDGAWEVIRKIATGNSNVRGVNLLFNVGQFSATICGMERARGKLVITMDDDFQHPPEDLGKLADAINAEPELDCVLGIYDTKAHSMARNLGSKLMMAINRRIYNTPPGLVMSSMRIMRREVALAVCAHQTARPVIGPLIIKSSRRLANVTVGHNPRKKGESGYSFYRLIRIAMDNIVSSSTFPLQVMSMGGLFLAISSSFLGAYYLILYLLTNVSHAKGFTTIVLLVTFFGGMTLFSIGLLGEYVIRIITEVGRPPRYFIRDEV